MRPRTLNTSQHPAPDPSRGLDDQRLHEQQQQARIGLLIASAIIRAVSGSAPQTSPSMLTDAGTPRPGETTAARQETAHMSTRTATSIPPLSAGPRVYLCVGPNCWGKGFTADDAIKVARHNHSPSLSGTWKYILFDAPADATVGGLGDIEWTPSHYTAPRGPVELLRKDGAR